jgi:hypothetical protein
MSEKQSKVMLNKTSQNVMPEEQVVIFLTQKSK